MVKEGRVPAIHQLHHMVTLNSVVSDEELERCIEETGFSVPHEKS